jgi:hypothetical protein
VAVSSGGKEIEIFLDYLRDLGGFISALVVGEGLIRALIHY